MESEAKHLAKNLQTRLMGLGFDDIDEVNTGYVFINSREDVCLIIDTTICHLQDYPYVEYTSTQNSLMEKHGRVFRFLLDETIPYQWLYDEIEMFLQGESDPDKIRRFGANRENAVPDPTLPEATFEDCFLEAFGDHARMGLHREFTYADMEGTTRYIDYALFGTVEKFAIELNGESFHHPVVIGPRKYRSQLFKQNSLVADGFKVFRWSLNGMKDRERFVLEVRRFMGDAQPFLDKPIFKAKRPVFTLKDHQKDSLVNLAEARRDGQNTFLLVLPTGTGKTEVFIKDIEQLKEQDPGLKALVIVPTRKLRGQTLARFLLRLPVELQNCISDDVVGDTTSDIYVQTAAYLHRNYYKIAQDYFDYIVVDEAHHAAAHGLRKILEHFTPDHLLGVTATPERFDQQKLEEIFGEYSPQLSLGDAIQKGLVPPVRCFRVKSNIDLSEVRFNGREFVKNDLQTTLLVPSRDQLIVDLLHRYFGGEFSYKQGVIFCVDIKHARRMADLLCKSGITAAAVDGKDRKKADEAQERYNLGSTRFLCACDLLTEGWDSPQTSILVMARPTFSKVLYTQQLGRGLRNYPGKEALYVIDVVDNYGAKLQPLSLHALLKIPNYLPFANLLDPNREDHQDEIIVLDGLFEGERRIEPVDILTFEETYGSFLNEEQLARELFVSTGTVRQWVKKGKIISDAKYPFGRRQLHFFDPQQVEIIREQNGLKKHSEETRVEDFKEFLDKRDYTFSYKIIFLLSFLKICNARSEAFLPDLLELYQRFYSEVLSRHGQNEKEKCPYNRQMYLDDGQEIKRSILANPFEKFERKRFFYHCKDLNYIALDPTLVNNIKSEQYDKIIEQMVHDLREYYEKIGISISEDDYSFLLDKKDSESSHILLVDNPTAEQKYSEYLPFYPLQVAAGTFNESDIPIEPESWFLVEGLTTRRSLSPSMFVARVSGKSMEPTIPDGSYCLFTFEIGGSRNGRIVLAQKSGLTDQDTGAGYTVKTYSSVKMAGEDSDWQHESISLLPVNPEYQEIVIPPEDADNFSVVAFFVEVLLGVELGK